MAIYDNKLERFYGGVSAFALIALLLSCATPASATLILADTVNAMPGWYDTAIIQFDESSGKNVDGSIDYAVYAPGNFNLSFPGQDPSGGAHYVYRYQLHNNASPTSTDYMRKLTVGLVPITNAANCKWIEPNTGPYPSGGVAPTQQVALIGSPPTSAVWSYRSNLWITPGNDSKILLFTSPFGPTFRPATVLSSSTTEWWEGQMPSPVPEPTTFFNLLAFGGFFLVCRALRRK